MKPIYTALLAGALLGATALPDARADGHAAALQQAVEARSAEDRARDAYRHPAETLAFFQVEPGMTVAEGLPGGGWYTRILASYLGSEGTLVGINYPDSLWAKFGYPEDWVAGRIASTAKFPEQVASFTDNGITAMGITFDTVPTALAGKVDRVLMIRAMHNLNRFEASDSARSDALAAISKMLAPEGLVGVVQHRAPEDASDESAAGQRGYLKQSTVVAAFEAAGFELVASSEINANPKDQPGETDIVWRLPPSLRGDPSQREAMQAIGESDRMTLLFKKAD
jgi:predicted methyltransferase